MIDHRKDGWGEGILPEELREKYAFAPGVPTDPAAIPTVRFQVLGGRVYTLEVWKDGSTVRGEMPLADLSHRFGRKVEQEGWYDVLGTYLGDDAGSED